VNDASSLMQKVTLPDSEFPSAINLQPSYLTLQTHLYLVFKSFYPNDCSEGIRACTEIHPKRGKIGLVFPESSSLPGRFFLGLSEEVCPVA